MAHGFYSKTLIRPPVSTSGQGIYLVPAYELFKESIYDRKKLKWNVGTEHIPVMIEATLKKTARNEKAIQTWLEGANWKNVTELVVDIDDKDIKEVSLGDVVKDQVKPGAKFNRGNVSEGILAAAIAARFVSKLGTVTPEHVNNILKKMTKKGKKLDSIFKGPNQNSKIDPDDVQLVIDMPAADMDALMNTKTINGPSFKDLVPAAVKYANERHVTKFAKLVYENNRTDHILVDSDGVGDMKGTKVDLKVEINGEPTTLNISLKAGQVKQFGQIGGGTPEAINNTFGPLGVELNSNEERNFNAFLSKGDPAGGMAYAYEEIEKKLSRLINSGDGSRFFKDLGKFVTFHATRNEPNVELVQLDRGEAHVLQFTNVGEKLAKLTFQTNLSTAENRTLSQLKYPTTQLSTLAIATRFSNDPKRQFFVSLRVKAEGKVDKDGNEYIYFRNIVEKGSEMSQFLKPA